MCIRDRVLVVAVRVCFPRFREQVPMGHVLPFSNWACPTHQTLFLVRGLQEVVDAPVPAGQPAKTLCNTKRRKRTMGSRPNTSAERFLQASPFGERKVLCERPDLKKQKLEIKTQKSKITSAFDWLESLVTQLPAITDFVFYHGRTGADGYGRADTGGRTRMDTDRHGRADTG